MRQSKNKSLSKNKYYNIQRGKKDNYFFFLLPSIVISPKKFLHWDVRMFSIFFGWGKYYLQYNIFETIRDSNTQVLKEDMMRLLQLLKKENLYLDSQQPSMKLALEYLNNNTYIINLLKNSNLEHTYIKKIIASYFKDLPFIVEK